MEIGVVVVGQEYELDCFIFVFGFEVGMEYKCCVGFDLKGRDGFRLFEYWVGGMWMKYGIYVYGFFNVFIVQLI